MSTLLSLGIHWLVWMHTWSPASYCLQAAALSKLLSCIRPSSVTYTEQRFWSLYNAICNVLLQLDLFQREAQVLASLSHPSIPTYIDYFEQDSGSDMAFYIVQVRRVLRWAGVSCGCMWLTQNNPPGAASKCNPALSLSDVSVFLL